MINKPHPLPPPRKVALVALLFREVRPPQIIMLLAQLLDRADGGSHGPMEGHTEAITHFKAPKMLFWLSPTLFKALCDPAVLAFPCPPAIWKIGG